MRKIILFILPLFTFAFLSVYQHSKIYILAYEIGSYQKKLDRLQLEEENLKCQHSYQRAIAFVDPQLENLHLSAAARYYVSIKTGKSRRERTSLLAKIFNLSPRAEAKP